MRTDSIISRKVVSEFRVTDFSRLRPTRSHINKVCNFLLVSAGKLDFPSLGKSLGNSASGRLRDPRSAAHVFSEARTGGRTPQTPKPFTNVPDTYLKYPNLEYKYHPLVDLFGVKPFVQILT